MLAHLLVLAGQQVLDADVLVQGLDALQLEARRLVDGGGERRRQPPARGAAERARADVQPELLRGAAVLEEGAVQRAAPLDHELHDAARAQLGQHLYVVVVVSPRRSV